MTDQEFLAMIEGGIKQGRPNLFLRSARRLYELAGDVKSVAYADDRLAAEPHGMVLVEFNEGVLAQLVRQARERIVVQIETTTTRRASQHGWLRRPDLGPHVWELPGGNLYTHFDGTEPMVATLPPFDWRTSDADT